MAPYDPNFFTPRDESDNMVRRYADITSEEQCEAREIPDNFNWPESRAQTFALQVVRNIEGSAAQKSAAHRRVADVYRDREQLVRTIRDAAETEDPDEALAAVLELRNMFADVDDEEQCQCLEHDTAADGFEFRGVIEVMKDIVRL